MTTLRWCVLAASLLALAGCDVDAHPVGDADALGDVVDAGEPWAWGLPAGVTPPEVPDHNPMTWAKVELGRYLFYEPRLSMNGELSCGSCHEQARGFTVDEATHQGATGDYTPRNAQGLANVAYAPLLTWGNPTLATLEDHMLNPLFGDNPVEMGAGFVAGLHALPGAACLQPGGRT